MVAFNLGEITTRWNKGKSIDPIPPITNVFFPHLILQEEKQREVYAPPIFSNNPPSAIAVKNTNMITSSKVPRCAHYGILIRPHSRQMFYKKISKPADSDIGNCWLSLTKQCSWSQFHKCFKSHGIVLSINPNSFMHVFSRSMDSVSNFKSNLFIDS